VTEASACLVWARLAGMVAAGLVVLVGLVAVVALALVDYQDECAHRRRMARARRRRHG